MPLESRLHRGRKHHGLPGRRGGLAAACAVLGLALASCAPAAAQVIGVVKTADDIPPFETAIGVLQKKGVGEVTVVSLAADKARWANVKDALAKKSPAVYVPVGPLALDQVAASGLAQPIVFMMVPSPNIPAGATNITGVRMRVDPGVQVRELNRLLPAAKRIGVLYDPRNTAEEVGAAEKVAGGLGLEIVHGKMGSVTELGSALDGLLAQDVDVLWLVADSTVTPPGNTDSFAYIAANTLKAGVPVVGYAAKLTEGGALFSLGPDYAEIGSQAAEIVRQVVAGAQPSSIGVQNARKAELSINKKVAATLGITLPADAVKQATQVFQ